MGSYFPVKEMSVSDIWNKSYTNCGNEIKMKKWLPSLRRSFLHFPFISAVHIWFISYIINTSLFIIISHWFKVRVSNQLAFRVRRATIWHYKVSVTVQTVACEQAILLGESREVTRKETRVRREKRRECDLSRLCRLLARSLRASSPFGGYREKYTRERHARGDATK